MDEQIKANNQVLTLEINGNITFDVFVEGVHNLKALADGVADQAAPGEKVLWVLDTLASGSAIIGIRPETARAELVPAMVAVWSKIARCLQEDSEIPYGDKIRKPASALVKLLSKDDVSSLLFQTDEEDILVSSPHDPKSRTDRVNKPKISFGSLKGRIDSLGRRRGVRFVLYDSLFDKPIPCYLGEGKEDMVREFWGRKVNVTGKITRDAETGKPYSIRAITGIELAETSAPGSWKNAVGILDFGGKGPERLKELRQ